MNYYVLYVQTQNQDVFVDLLNRNKNVFSYNPKFEYYRRDINGIAIKSLFPGYVIVKSNLDQKEFNDILKSMEVKKGFLKELKYEKASALTDEEISVLNNLLDDQGILRMSYGHLENRRIVIDDGPLVGYESYVTKLDKHNRLVHFDLYFLEKQRWIAGMILKTDDNI